MWSDHALQLAALRSGMVAHCAERTHVVLRRTTPVPLCFVKWHLRL
jgi:hypothetical protein